MKLSVTYYFLTIKQQQPHKNAYTYYLYYFMLALSHCVTNKCINCILAQFISGLLQYVEIKLCSL